MSYNTETNWVCPPLKDAFNPSKHDVLLDIIWHMYNAVQSYCFTEFHESYRMFHKYGMAITDIFTTPIKARWYRAEKYSVWSSIFCWYKLYWYWGLSTTGTTMVTSLKRETSLFGSNSLDPTTKYFYEISSAAHTQLESRLKCQPVDHGIPFQGPFDSAIIELLSPGKLIASVLINFDTKLYAAIWNDDLRPNLLSATYLERLLRLRAEVQTQRFEASIERLSSSTRYST